MKRNAQYIIWGMSIMSVLAVVYFYYPKVEETPIEEAVSELPPFDYWEMFSRISLKRKFVEEAEAYYRTPVFTPELLNHAGKEVTLVGYYLPYSKQDSIIIISRFPNSSCFFCGRAGIESVAMVKLDRQSRNLFRTDDRLEVTGRLTLNSTDIQKLAFVIVDARIEKL